MTPTVPINRRWTGWTTSGARWEADGTFRFDPSKTRDRIFSIDTPPPT